MGFRRALRRLLSEATAGTTRQAGFRRARAGRPLHRGGVIALPACVRRLLLHMNGDDVGTVILLVADRGGKMPQQLQ